MINEDYNLIEARKILEYACIKTEDLEKEVIKEVARKWKNNIPLTTHLVKRLSPAIPRFFRNPIGHKAKLVWPLSIYNKWIKLALFEVNPQDHTCFNCSHFGALDIANWITGGVEVLSHGTPDCVSCYNYHRPRVNPQYQFPSIYSTGVKEKEVVLGGRDILIESLNEIYRRKKPEMLILITTCSSDIIGEDITCLSDEVSFPLKIIPVNTGGCSGIGFREGANKVLTKIFEQLPKCIKKEKSVNLVAKRIASVPSQALEFKDISDLLEPLGIGVNVKFGKGISLKEVLNLPKAMINAPLCLDMGETALKFASNRFNQVLLQQLPPVGAVAIYEWIRKIAEVCKVSITKIQPRIKQIEEEAWNFFEKNNLIGRTIVIMMPLGKALPLARFMAHFGAKPLIIGIKPFQVAQVQGSLDQLIANDKDFDVFLGGFDELEVYLNEIGQYEALFLMKKKLYRFRNYPQATFHFFSQPFIGISGQKNILTQIECALESFKNGEDMLLFDKFHPEQYFGEKVLFINETK